jgi:hypothetical protein
MKTLFSILLAIIWMAASGQGQTLYTNGIDPGTDEQSPYVSYGNGVYDSFHVPEAQLHNIQLSLWGTDEATPNFAHYRIWDSTGTNMLDFGSGSLYCPTHFEQRVYWVYSCKFTDGVYAQLPAGDYWLEIFGVTGTTDFWFRWGVSFGPSQAYTRTLGADGINDSVFGPSIGSESFQILGETE